MIKFVLEVSENKCKQAKEVSFKKLEDKESEAIPENLLLNEISGEDSKDRMDRR
jgi:hypothetical protein